MIYILKSQSFLQAFSSISLGGILKAILGYIFLAIDSVVYFFVAQGFKMYIALAQFKLFDENVFKDLINRTYIVIGVIALFIVAYALINSIINPDNASKGGKSFGKIIKNFIFAIIGIAIVPTVFNYFYYFQRVVLCNNLIPRILLAQKGDNSEADLLNDDKIGTKFATYLFQSFFYPKSIENMNMTDIDNDGDLLKSEATKVEVGLIDDIFNDEETVNIEKYKEYDSATQGKYNLQTAYEAAMDGEMFFTAFRPFLLGDLAFANSVLNNTVNYMIIISTIAGVYCAYVLASLCIDMAVRAVKLGYLELIAPLPIMTLIIPGKDSVFKAWIKKTTSCAFEVFTRLFIVSFVIYLIRTIPQLFTATTFSYGGCTTSFGVITALLIRALVYCGLLTFLKQAPKFLSEATGIKSDGFKLGIADKLGEMALIGDAAKNGVRAAQGAATGALGGLATGLGNRDKIGLKSAMMQGATQGFKGKGNQFSKQRKSTFQSIGEYEDKDQGLFGGESKVSKYINDHKKDVKKDYTEYGTDYKNNIEKSKMMNDLKTETNFGEEAHKKRMKDFANSEIMKKAIDYAKHQQEITGVFSEKAQQDAISTFLENTRTTTQDKNLARSIYQFQKEQDADKLYRAMSKYTNEEKNMTEAKIAEKISDFETQQKDVLKRKSDHENAIKSLESQIATQKKYLEDYGSQIPQQAQDYMNAEIDSLNKKIESHRSNISDLESQSDQLSASKSRLEDLKENRDKYVAKINEMAIDVLLGNGSIDASGQDYSTHLDDTENGMLKEYRGFDAGIKTANKVTTTDDYLKELINLSKKNNKE